ncbi:ATP-binding protein [candidate division KSB1 bacterium]|nr:ATP-binding protein [candidate division KSB1 bacterium]
MKHYRLLLIDNDLERIKLIRELLEEKEFEVLTVGDGNSAINLFRSQPFDLILTNIMLNDMDGVEIVTAIREIDHELPVIIMSSSSHANKAIKALYAGAHHFVREPIEIEELVQTIEKLLCYRQEHDSYKKVYPYLEQKVVFQIPGDYSFMGGVIQYLNAILVKIGIQEEDDIQVKVSLLESITNAIEHGNHGNANKKVEIEAQITAEKAIFTIKDQGKGFDYQNLPDPTEPENIIKARGRGIFMIQNLMDEVSFNAKGNVITMIKYRPDHEKHKKMIA